LWHDLVFHERAGELLLLNGGPETGKQPQDELELWSWDGTAWRAVPSTGGPRWRNQASAVYDSKRGVLVLYGGVQADTEFADTWEWDGERWTERAVAGPGSREAAGIAFDAARGETVLFGGAAKGDLRGDTWTWNGERWTRASESGPSARFPAGMTYDARREVVLLFGGHEVDARGFRTHGDTWTWNGKAWKSVTVAGPSARDGARAVYDARTDRVLLFGGAEIGPGVRHLGDLWAWDGTGWTKRAESGPAGRVHAAFAFDPRRGRFVLAGGSNAPGSVLSDVWELEGERWTCVLGCP
jgi:hypothetical protein